MCVITCHCHTHTKKKMSQARYTQGYYGVDAGPQEDFGFQHGMALPPGTMPSEKESGRKRAATFSVKADAELPAQKPSLGAKLRSFFKRGKQQKVEEVVVAESGTVESSTFERSDVRGKAQVTFKESTGGKLRRVKSLTLPEKSGDQEEKAKPAKTSQSFDEGRVLLIKLTLKPKNAVSSIETRKVTLRRQPDGFGVHLSAGLPPITVTYVKTGGMAELAGVQVGDVVVEANGQDCTKGVEISKIMELKMLLQQTLVSVDTLEVFGGETQDLDDSAWKRIKERQESLESDTSDVEITMIDDESESENEQQAEPMAVEKPTKAPENAKPKKRKTKKKKDTSLTETGSPMAEQQQDLENTSPTAGTQERKRVKKSKPRPPATTSEAPPTGETTVPETVTTETKPKKRKPKKEDTSATDDTWTQQQDFILNETPAVEGKKRVKKAKTKATTALGTSPTPAEPVVTASESATSEVPVNETPTPTVAAAATATDNRVAPGREILLSPDGRVRIKKGGKKRKKSKTLTDDGRPITSSSPEKRQKKHSTSRKTSDGEGKLNKSKSGSVQSDDLEWVGANGDNKRSLERRLKDNDGEILGLSPIKQGKRSPSYHGAIGEDIKPFRDELRQASKSDYDMPTSYGDRENLDNDPNFRVRKSGVVIGGRGEKRPSIFDQSSSLEETDQGIDNEGAERKVSEMDLSAIPKLNPSLGLSHGHDRLDLVSRGSNRRRPASLRKALLLDTEDAALMGTKRVDLSAGDDKPLRRQTMPSQPTAQNKSKTGKSKDDSSSKTPPVSPLKQLEKEKPTNHILEAHLNRMKNPLFSPSTNNFSTAATVKKQLSQNGSDKSFEIPTRQSVVSDDSKDTTPSSPSRVAGIRVKTVDTPVKTLGITSEASPTKTTSPVKLRRAGEAASTPSWVAIAQVKQKRISAVFNETKPDTSNKEVKKPETILEDNKKVSSPSTTSSLPPHRGDPLLPRAGTVKDRLALFQ